MSGVEKSWEPDAPGALDGIRVLDLSRLVAGNAVTHVLADHGAEVIKIEKPGVGDDLRNWKTEGVSTHWKVYCRNKKSVTLDFRPRSEEKTSELQLRMCNQYSVFCWNKKNTHHVATITHY